MSTFSATKMQIIPEHYKEEEKTLESKILKAEKAFEKAKAGLLNAQVILRNKFEIIFLTFNNFNRLNLQVVRQT